jgi:hypothetical protein
MPRKLFVSASLVLVMVSPAVLSRPPEGPSGRMVLDEVTQLQTEVQRLEKGVANDKSDKSKADDLAVARARLLAAEGRTEAACAAWRKIIASREDQLARWQLLILKGKICTSEDESALLRGPVAEGRCGLAEVEGDKAALVRELPKVIAYHETRLGIIDRLRKVRAYEAEETEEERAIRKELHKAQRRLDTVKRK